MASVVRAYALIFCRSSSTPAPSSFAPTRIRSIMPSSLVSSIGESKSPSVISSSASDFFLRANSPHIHSVTCVSDGDWYLPLSHISKYVSHA